MAAEGLVWTVATVNGSGADFGTEAAQCLALLERHLVETGSARSRILSIQVLLSDIADRAEFDRLWVEWIGPNPEHWPQRACFQAGLAPGLRVELVAVAARQES